MMLLAIDVVPTLHRSVNHVVEILSRLVVRRDECRVRVFDVLVRDGGQALLVRPDFVHTAFLVKPFDGTVHLAAKTIASTRSRVSYRFVNASIASGSFSRCLSFGTRGQSLAKKA